MMSSTPVIFNGIIDDFTPVLDASGPWQVSGKWTLTLTGYSGRENFTAALNMVRAENPANRSPHTHQITISDGQVTSLPNGFQVSGNATITANGNLAFSGSPVTVHITGGSAVPFSNIALTFGGAAVAHFNDQPLHGVVTQ
jgi:hypothetical protein